MNVGALFAAIESDRRRREEDWEEDDRIDAERRAARRELYAEDRHVPLRPYSTYEAGAMMTQNEKADMWWFITLVTFLVGVAGIIFGLYQLIGMFV